MEKKNKRFEQFDIEYLIFPEIEQLGVVKHLFSTRKGGVSEGEFSTMNLSFTRGDNPDAVEENFKRIAATMERTLGDFVLSDQTHTTNVLRVSEKHKGMGVNRPRTYADVDGLVTNEPGIVLGTFFADCVPLYFVDPVAHAIGLSHSGWKGTVGKIGARTVTSMMEEFGSRPEHIHVGIGPSICRECYEVSEDVKEEFVRVFGEKPHKSKEEAIRNNGILYETGGNKFQLDLWKANEKIMLEAGISKEHIYITDFCTCCNADYLFSHRKTNGKRGNLGAFLSL